MKKKEIREMIEQAGGDRMVQDKLIELVCEIMEVLEEKDPQEMKRIEKKMYDNGIKMKNGTFEGFDKEEAEYIVNQIYDRNNISQNQRLFTYQKAEQLAKQHKIPLNDFTVEDWYITLVMAESDFKELLGTNLDNYVTYAKLWLMDKDAPNGASTKLYDYLCYVAQVIDEDESKKGYDNGYGRMNMGMGGYGNSRYNNNMYHRPQMDGRYNSGYNYGYGQEDNGYDYDNGGMYQSPSPYDNRIGYSNGRNQMRQNRDYYNQMTRGGSGNRRY